MRRFCPAHPVKSTMITSQQVDRRQAILYPGSSPDRLCIRIQILLGILETDSVLSGVGQVPGVAPIELRLRTG